MRADESSAFLVHAVEQLSQSLHVETTLNALAELVVPALADIASVWSRTDGVVRRVAVCPPGLFPGGELPLQGKDRLAEMFDARHARRFDDILDWAKAQETSYALAVEKLDPRAAVLVPVRAHDRTVAVLSIAMTTSDRIFADHDLQLLEALGRHAGLAVENSRLFEQAERSRRAAEAATLAKDQFLATVSHELRTPLTAILGWARMIRQDTTGKPELLAKGLDVIERNARTQAQLIDDLLDVSRIVAGKLEVRPTSVSVSSVIDRAIDTARPGLQAKEITLDVEIDRDVTTVNADGGRLEQVIWNLVTNAAKFTPPRGRIRVGARQLENRLEIFVTDDGRGIPSDLLPHVFERFRQGDGAASGAVSGQAAQGLGLGLAIARHIVELHGGQISATSDGLGKGATFTVSLPVASASSTRSLVDAASTEAARAPGEEALPLTGAHILIVEDEDDARELLVAILRSAGAEVSEFSGVDAALAHLEGFTPDAIVSDVAMPVRDGYGLVREIRSREAAASAMTAGAHAAPLPVIALTAFASGADRSRALDAGFTAHLAKPVEPRELLRTIAMLLGREISPTSSPF